MLFNANQAISQPTHAWISGQILREWAEPLSRPLLLAAEQHDIAWLDWETAPSYDPNTSRPHLFRDIGASIHAPMWTSGVDRALAAWGAHAALLISRHGGVIYRRFTDRHRVDPADAEAAERYLTTQAPKEAAWTRALGLDNKILARETDLLALSDTLSLVLCGELATPLDIQADGQTLNLQERNDGTFTVSPWPFRNDDIIVQGEARPLPPAGRFAGEAEMRAWLIRPERAKFRARLVPA